MRPLRAIGLLTFVSSLLLLLGGCPTTSPNTHEATPPTLSWNVYDVNSRTSQNFTGNQVYTPTLGHEYRVTFTATDPGGIQQITLGDTRQWDCSTAVGGSPGHYHVGPLSDPTDTQNMPAQGNVLTSLLLMRDITINAGQGQPWSCDAGTVFDCGNTTVVGTGTNFSNRTATASLSLFFRVGYVETALCHSNP
jgi:hypothetical protein